MSEKPLRASTRVVLTRDLENLHNKFLKVVNNTYQITRLSLAISSAKQSSSFLEEKVNAFNQSIKEDILDLENLALKILSLQQPLLKDLRFVIGILKVSENIKHLNEQILQFVVLYSSNLTPLELEKEEEKKEKKVLDQISEINENLASFIQYFLEAIKSESVESLKALLVKIENKSSFYSTTLKEAAGLESFDKSFYLFELVRLQERIKDLILIITKEISFIYHEEKI